MNARTLRRRGLQGILCALALVTSAGPALTDERLTLRGGAIADMLAPVVTDSTFAIAGEPAGDWFARFAATLAGMLPQRRNDALSRVVGRGLGADRVGSLDDGFPVRSFPAADLDGTALDPRGAARVALRRGAASLRYTSDPMAGVLALEPPAPPDSALPGVRDGGEIAGASGARAAAARLGLAGAGNDWVWRLEGGGRRQGDVRTPEGEVPSTASAIGGHASAVRSFPSGEVGLRFAREGGTFDLPLGPDVESAGPGLSRDLDDVRLQGHGHLDLAGNALALRGQWERRAVDASAEGFTRAPIDLRHDTYFLEVADGGARGPWNWTAGMNGLVQHLVEHDAEPVLPESRVANGAAFAIAQLRSGRWRAAAAGRGDAHHVEASESAPLTLPAQSRGVHGGSGAIDLEWTATEPLTLVLTAGRSWRPPALDELYSHGPDPGRDRYVIGTRDLGAESGLGFEAGADWRSAHAGGSVRGFHRRIEGYVSLDPTTEVRSGLPVHRYTAHDAAFTGAEADARLELAHGLFASGRVDYVSAEDRDSQAALASIPPPRWGIALEHRRSTRWREARAAFAAEVRGAGRSTRVGPGDVPTEPYALLDLRGALRWSHEHGSVAIELRVANVADTPHREFLAAGEGVGEGEGRSFELRFSAER